MTLKQIKITILLLFLSLQYSLPSIGQTDILSLDSCRVLAINYNKKVQASKSDEQASQEQIKFEKTERLPRLDFLADYTYIGKPTAPRAAQDLFPDLKLQLGFHHNYYGTLSLAQEIYGGGRIRNEIKLAESVNRALKQDVRLKKVDVLLQTDLTYWQAVAAKERLRFTQEYVEIVKELLKVARDKYETEVASKNDLLMSQVRLNDAELTKLKSENEYRIAIMALNRFIGLPIEETSSVIDSITVSFNLTDSTNIVERAFEQRPELGILKGEKESLEAQKNIFMSPYKGSLTIGANGLWGAPSPELTSDPEFNYNAFALFAIPIFHANEKRHIHQSSQLNIDAAQKRIEDTKDAINLEVKQNEYLLDEAIKQVELTNNSTERAQENLDLVTQRYLDGVTPILDVLNAQIYYQQAFVNFINAKQNYQARYSQYLKSVGELFIGNR